MELKACLLLTDRDVFTTLLLAMVAVGSRAVACSLLNLFIPCKLLAVVNLCEEEGM